MLCQQGSHLLRREEKQFSPILSKILYALAILRISGCGKAVKNVCEVVD